MMESVEQSRAAVIMNRLSKIGKRLMRVKLRGINQIKRKLASGEEATYYYHRATGIRLSGQPNSPDFLASYAQAEASLQARHSDGTLSGLIRKYEQSVRWREKTADSTKAEYRRILKFWEELYGSCPLEALEDDEFLHDVMDWHADYSADHPREADNRVTVLASALSWAAKNRRGIKVNVLAGFERAYKNNRADFIWLPEHVDAFMAVASPEMRLALILALHTGQRQADLLKLTWDRYDGSRFRLRQGKAARGGAQAPLISIPCTKALKETLDSIKPGRSPLILSTSTGRPFSKRYFSKHWKEACQNAGITDLHFHDLRGTTVTLLFQAGCNLGEIVSVTGHTLKRAQDILDKYLARTNTMAENAIAKFEGVWETDYCKTACKTEEQN